jgi:hypothetical protein
MAFSYTSVAGQVTVGVVLLHLAVLTLSEKVTLGLGSNTVACQVTLGVKVTLTYQVT